MERWKTSNDAVVAANNDLQLGGGALEAARTYGKAVGHEADLNFGDCFAYACAKGYRAALLYKGDDFAKTDLAFRSSASAAKAMR